MLIIMKNIIISGNNNISCPKNKQNQLQSKLENAIEYFHNIIQKTIISIQKYKQLDILGANELNLATHNLEKIYFDLSSNLVLLKQKDNIEKVTINFRGY